MVADERTEQSSNDSGAAIDRAGGEADDGIGAPLRRWFAAECDEQKDDRRRDEIRALEASLLRPGVLHGCITPLVRRHHLEIETVLLPLNMFRLRWAFENPHAIFRYSVKDIEMFPSRLEAAASILEIAAPRLYEQWTLAAMDLQGDAKGVGPATMTRLYTALATPPKWNASKADREAYANLLAQRDSAELGFVVTEHGLTGRRAVEVAIAVLRTAAATINGLDWATAETPDGRPIYGRHRRQKLFVERECAGVLLTLFEEETSKPLYDYVGALLAATFPSLAHWERCNGRFRDLVKELTANRRNGAGG